MIWWIGFLVPVSKRWHFYPSSSIPKNNISIMLKVGPSEVNRVHLQENIFAQLHEQFKWRLKGIELCRGEPRCKQGGQPLHNFFKILKCTFYFIYILYFLKKKFFFWKFLLILQNFMHFLPIVSLRKVSWVASSM